MPQEGVTLKLSVFVVLGTPEAVARYRQAVIEAKRWVCKEFEVMEKDIPLAPTCVKPPDIPGGESGEPCVQQGWDSADFE